MSWQDLVGFEEDYEICDEYPYQIRKKSNGKILNDFNGGNGYVQVWLNKHPYLKHRIIAEQFIPNPENLPFVDHKNQIRDDNRIDNLRWVNYSKNNENKSGSNGVDYIIIDYDDCPDDLIIVDKYNQHKFEDYYYSPENNRFYFDTGVNLRELYINYARGYSAYVNARSIENTKVKICFTKFKKLYGIDF